MFPVPEFSSFSLVFIPQESLLTLVVKEESLPCSYPWVSFTSCGMFTRCCCSMLGHSLLICEEPPVPVLKEKLEWVLLVLFPDRNGTRNPILGSVLLQ
jgi:hypothetical protein